MSAWDDVEGTVLDGRYEVGARLGRGGGGVVHQAWDRVRERAVAVKLLPAGSGLAPQRPGRSEADLLGALDHPDLVALHDVLRTGDGPVLVMELVDGPSLHERLDDGPLSLQDGATVLRHVAAGLAHAHRRGIVHRDVKPGNVLLVPTGNRVAEARLADFGIARAEDATRTTAERTVVGTVRFLSPEQLRGERVTPASDVYSLGLTLLAALTGEDPFPGSDTASLAARLVRAPAVSHDLPPAWADLLRSMTALDPADRPTAAAVAAAAGTLREPHLVPASTARTLGSHPVGRPALRARRTARALALGGAVAVLGGSLGAALAVTFAPPAPSDVLAEAGPGAASPAAAAPSAPTSEATAAEQAAQPKRVDPAAVPAAGTARTPEDDRGRDDDSARDDSRSGTSGGDRSGHGSGGHGSDD